MLCLSIFTGATTGCGGEEDSSVSSASFTSVEGSDTKTADTAAPENAPEMVNASGLPLMDGTTFPPT